MISIFTAIYDLGATPRGSGGLLSIERGGIGGLLSRLSLGYLLSGGIGGLIRSSLLVIGGRWPLNSFGGSGLSGGIFGFSEANAAPDVIITPANTTAVKTLLLIVFTSPFSFHSLT